MHPLSQDLSKLTIDELVKKIGELQKRITQCYSFGPQALLPQLQMLLDDYNMELQVRNQRQLEEMQKNSKQFKNIIDIQ